MSETEDEVTQITIQILDKDYPISCPSCESEALLQAARHLDSKMREIQDTGKVIGLDRVAVMAALNITHEMLGQRQEKNRVQHLYSERIKQMQNKLDQSLQSINDGAESNS